MPTPVTLTLPSGARLEVDLEAAVQDQAARALMGRLARMRGVAAGELIAYIALWRPPVQALRWSRALAIAEDVERMAAEHGPERVTAALTAALDTLIPRSAGPDWTALKNHRYLLTCLSGIPAAPPVGAPPRRDGTQAAPQAQPGATLRGIAALEALR